MVLRVFSDQQLSQDEYDQVTEILKQSNCPHESLSNTFPDKYQRLVEIGDEIHVYFSKLSSPLYEQVQLHFSIRDDNYE